MTKGGAYQIQSSQPNVRAWPHTQYFSGTNPQGPFWYTNDFAELPHTQLLIRVRRQHILKTSHNLRVVSPSSHMIGRIDRRQALDQRRDQLLLKGSCAFSVRDDIGLGLGDATCFGQQASQIGCCNRRGSQNSACGWRGEISASNDFAKLGEGRRQ